MINTSATAAPSAKPADQPADQPARAYDALVVGGGPAGLQAAITLARVHRTVALVDSGAPRNQAATAMHNFLTHDGTHPATFRAAARAEAEALGVAFVADAVTEVRGEADRFEAALNSGATLSARRVVLATGVRDVLPDVAGLAGLYGSLVNHCPFCHGHEFAGGRVGILAGERAGHLRALLTPIAGEVLVLDGVTEVARAGDGLVARSPEGEVALDGLFIATELVPVSDLASRLGADVLPDGCTEIDLFGRTSLPGLFAAGDGAHHRDLPGPASSVLAAAAAGGTAGGACAADLALSPVPA